MMPVSMVKRVWPASEKPPVLVVVGGCNPEEHRVSGTQMSFQVLGLRVQDFQKPYVNALFCFGLWAAQMVCGTCLLNGLNLRGNSGNLKETSATRGAASATPIPEPKVPKSQSSQAAKPSLQNFYIDYTDSSLKREAAGPKNQHRPQPNI